MTRRAYLGTVVAAGAIALALAGCGTSTTGPLLFPAPTPTAKPDRSNPGPGGGGAGPTATPAATPNPGTIYAFNWSGNSPAPSPTFDGQQPKGSLVYVNGILFGRTAAGGYSRSNDNGCGTVFSINPNGTNYVVLYRFNSGGNGSDGCDPRHDAPVLYNGNLYASTQGVSNGTQSSNGVAYNNGNMFSIPAVASPNPITIVHSWAGQPDGAQQHSQWSIDPSTGLFYGMTASGGDNDKGLIYSITSGGSITPLFSLVKDSVTGTDPHDRIILLNGTLYGVTRKGGPSGGGIIFSLSTPAPNSTLGPGYTILHTFGQVSNDGFQSDHGYVTATNNNNVLYGMTTCGGSNGGTSSSCGGNKSSEGFGIIYQLSLSPAGYSIVYTFGGGADGGNPYGSLISDGTYLYGTTAYGGASGKGTVFRLPITSFGTAATPQTLWNFGRHPNDGYKPIDNVIPLSPGGPLCGMTVYGGSPNPSSDGTNNTGDGTVFCVPIIPTSGA